ncbi:MAG: hypothetical protein JSV04_12575 [Candidatus Heimdallarchaeota archaeon]|nr:MAG: hypothetical protein JSV04_12575 [Candidatus Heimdallarchaeota archaeon]
MAGIAHLGIGLAFAMLVPDVHVIILIFCAYLLDIVFIGFMFAGLENIPSQDQPAVASWSHSLLMAGVWTILAGLITAIFTQDLYTTVIIGTLVFSHWLVDFIVSPMTYVFPSDTGKPLHPFSGSPKVGLGVMRTKLGVMLSEGVPLTLGIMIFISTLSI